MIRNRPLPTHVERQIDTLGRAFERCPGVVFAYVFGGLAAGRVRPLSDADVAIYLAETVDPVVGWLDTLECVTAHLGTDAVDLVMLNTAPVSLAGRILQTRRVVYERDPLWRHRFESRVLREFFDFRIWEHRLLRRRYGRG